MNDMSAVIAPKVDQLTADHLLAGPITIRIASVEIRPGAEQPVTIHYEGEEGFPWRPCKSMSRVLVAAWGPDANTYPGRSATLYRDPSVKWGGMEVGGIRVSHLSHIDRGMVLALTATKGNKKPYQVKVLDAKPPEPKKDNAAVAAAEIVARVDAAETLDALKEITGAETVVKQRAWMADKRRDLAETIDKAIEAALARLDHPAGQE